MKYQNRRWDLIKTDDSVDNLVVGFVRDVSYVLTIPAVVKQEKGENNDDELMIVGVTPATMDPPLIQKVKKEPRTPPLSPNRGQGMKEVSEDGSSSRKLWRKHRKMMSLASRHLQKNQKRPSQQMRKGRVLL